MTDTNKLEIEKEALIFYADRLKMQVFEKQFEIDKAYKVVEEAQDKIRELNIKNDQLEKDLLSLHETLEKTESELAKVKSENLFLMNFVPEDCDCKMKGECRLCPKYTGEKQ